MELLIVTGMSGAGKTQALRTLEDIGYYCVDNLPPQLLAYLLDFDYESGMVREKTAVTVDIRSQMLLNHVDIVRSGLAEKGVTTRILFLEAADETIRRRYKETRRLHPLVQQGKAASLTEAIRLEREELEALKEIADVVLDTSNLQTKDLRHCVLKIFAPADLETMSIEFVAFGFKYGILADADLVFDLRCLPNPYYDEKLRLLTGDDQAVRDYVMQGEDGPLMKEKILDLLRVSIPLYRKEGKSRLVVGFGCTGGQHRSLAMAGLLQEALEEEYPGIQLICRDKDENRYEVSRR
ncbi:MAG: RNase adapter RapZ [Lachnospiraceae bacterium]|nr:RNase adapter RapZ [Lachnospiraceae bacterium]